MNRRRWIRNVAGTTLLLMMTPNHFNRLFGAENSVKSHNGKIETRSFGDISITWIRDNAKEGFMNNSLFSDFDQEILLRVSPDGKMPSTVSCYLLQTEGKNILFDTGNGAEDSLLLKALESLSITPNDINAIFLTHLHGDHIGGLVKDGKPVFEKASVFISTPEYDGWMNMEEERKNKTFAILETYKNKIHLFNFSDTLPYGIVALDASGHTPGHTIYRIGNCMIVGDFSDFDQEILLRVSPDGKMPSTVSCYLLQTEGKNILFDTGNGAEDSLLLKALESLSITPNDINAIFLTHLHGDHIGGLVKDGKPVFEKASVFISTPEYDGWMNMEEERKNKTFAILETYKNKIHLFNFSDTLPYGIVALDASGHTPGHTIYRIGNCMIVGDLFHAVALQLEYPDACAAYDMDKEKAIGSRKKYLQYIKDENLVFAGMHFPSPVFREFEKD